MPKDKKEALKSLAAKLLLASAKAKKVGQDASAADVFVDQVEKETK